MHPPKWRIDVSLPRLAARKLERATLDFHAVTVLAMV
jgi:hypothetical protein